jgi:hypothetical protein
MCSTKNNVRGQLIVTSRYGNVFWRDGYHPSSKYFKFSIAAFF